jgi:amino acid adenylation domain-containing protein/non-ribosomal peptide synthase protein (TIGR01720 family)
LRQPNRLAYVFLRADDGEESTLTYAELDRRARGVAVALRERDIHEGRALLLYPPGLDFLAGFFGCLYAGVAAVPAYPPDPSRLGRTLPRLRAIAADAQPIVALTVSAVTKEARPFLANAPDLDSFPWIETDSLGDIDQDAWLEPEVGRESLAFLQYTSGSTGSPKGVKLTHENLLHNAAMVYSAFEHTREDVYVSWLPTFHDMGFMAGVLQPLYAGIPAIAMSPISFLQQPIKWLAAISRYKGTTSGGPNFAYDLCVRKISDDEKAGLDLSSWTVAFNGAEPVRAETIDRFAESFESCGFRREAFYPCYGLAEATLIVTGGRKSEAPIVDSRTEQLDAVERPPGTPGEIDKRLVGCGWALLDQRIAIVEPERLTECGPGRTGEIWIRGSSVAQGYWNRVEETRAVFEGFIAGIGEGPFLRTGDLGFIRDRELFVNGRLKDLIIIRGVNHYPQDIELTVECCHQALRPGCGAAFSVEALGEERLVVVHEVDTARQPCAESLIEQIRAEIAATHELQVYAVALLKPGAVLKTSSGKIRRRECRSAFLSGSLKTVAQWQAADPDRDEPETDYPADATTMVSWLSGLVAGRAGVDKSEINPSRSVIEHGIDSLNAFEISHIIEERTGAALGAGELLRGSTIMKLAQIVLERARPDSRSPVVARREVPSEFPLSQGQRGLWFLQKLDPLSPLYNIVWAVQVKSGLDVRSLRAAVQALVDRHACLRTTFVAGPDGPAQRVHDQVQAGFIVEHSVQWSNAAVTKYLEERAQEAVDLDQGPLLRISVLARPFGEYILLLCVHHLIADFWSLSLIGQELGLLYEAELRGTKARLAPLTSHYCDYVFREADLLDRSEGERLSRYWSDRLTPEPAPLNLPTDRPRPPSRTYRGACLPFRIDCKIANRLNAVARRYGATLYSTLLAVFQTLMYRYTGQRQIVVGSPASGRTVREFEPVVGYFANMLPLRVDLSDGLPFAELLAQVQRTAAEALDHQEFPFPLMVDRLGIPRDLSRSPTFQVAFTFQKSGVPGGQAMSLFAVGQSNAQITLGGLDLEAIPLEKKTAEYDITLSMAESPEGFAALLEYSLDLFDHTTIERLSGHFQTLLESVAGRPEVLISRASLLRANEAGSMLFPTRSEGSERAVGSLVELFEGQVARRPDGVAVSFEDASVCYAELNLRANKLARYLQKLGAGAEQLVGLCVERSLDLTVWLLGVLKSGAAYVPLDPSYPADRLSLILQDSGLRILVTQGSVIEQLGPVSARTIVVDRDWDLIDTENGQNLNTRLSRDTAAYVIYTSGSTGTPKGVVVSQWNVIRLFDATFERLHFSQDDVWTLFHSYAFDFSVWEFWGALIYGGRLVIVPFWVSRTPGSFHHLLAAEGVSVLNQTPSAFRQLVDSQNGTESERIPTLRTVILGGEALDVNALRGWIDNRGDAAPQIVNMYGITETTVHVTFRRIAADDLNAAPRSPIGVPIDDLQIYILDSQLQPVPLSLAGEICVGGQGVARGYLNRPDLTAERFVPDHWSLVRGARMYRSGDLARLTSQQDAEYLGRLDEQIKIRGFRVEPGEIEAVMRSHPQVAQSVVIARVDNAPQVQLIGYAVPRAGEQLSTDELKSYLKRRLPEYMLPAAIMVLNEIPLTPHGKLDRKALPPPDWPAGGSDRGFVPPSNPVEQALAGVWSSVLGVPRIGITDNFFDLGGDSILSMQVVSRAREIGLDLSPKQVFQHQIIGELAAVAKAAPETALTAPSEARQEFIDTRLLAQIEAERGPVDDVFPLSWTQQGILFHTLSDSGSGVYCVQVIFEMRGQLKDDAFQQAWQSLMDRHPLLRAEFEWEGVREPVHIVKKHVPLALRQFDWRHVDAQQRRLEEFLSDDRLAGFNLREAPLMRVASIRVGDEARWCVWTSHHLLFDGWSAALVLKEVFDIYDALDDGCQPPQPPAPSFNEFVFWLRQRNQSAAEKFWRETLKGFTAPTNLGFMRPPASREGAACTSGRDPERGDDSYHEESMTASRELTRALLSFAHSHRITLSALVQSVWAIALSRYSGEEDVVFGLTLAGRPPELEAAESGIGVFITTLPLRVQVRPGEPVIDLVKEVQNRCIALQEHQYVPLAKIQEWSGVQNGVALFESIVVFENYPVDASLLARGSQPEIRNVRSIEQTNYPLTIAAIPGSELALHIGYEASKFDAALVQGILSHLRTLLANVAQNPRCRVRDLEILSAAERLQIEGWNGRAEHQFEELCLHELFQQQVARTPDGVALIFQDESITYRQLESRSNGIAQLMSAAGVSGPECVAVCLDRGPELMAAVLAVLKRGCVYLPLDPNLPPQRLDFLLDDAGAQLTIASGSFSRAGEPGSPRVLDLGDKSQAASGGRVVQVSPKQIAYVIYTSGSTGKPKGVMVSHSAVANHMQWMAGEFPLSSCDRVLQKYSIGFDASICEIFYPLVCGAGLVIAPSGNEYDVEQLIDLMSERQVTTIDMVPAMLEAILDDDRITGCKTLKRVFCGGELLPAGVARLVFDRFPQALLVNAYGPTEAAITATSHRIEPDCRGLVVPIGMAISNTSVLIVDENLRLQPIGVIGEICIAGAGLSAGYMNLPDLSAERFIPNPFATIVGQRLYRTGDLGFYQSDGALVYSGRSDEQIKIRGFRIEPREIEPVLNRCSGIRNSAVAVREDESGHSRLVAYLVPQSDAPPLETVQDRLKRELPHYMLPSRYVFVDQLPLSAGGKINRSALPPFDFSAEPERRHQAPRSEVERNLASIWESVLGLTRAGVRDNFFEIGGDSISSIQVVARAREAGLKITPKQIFDHPTIADLAQVAHRGAKTVIYDLASGVAPLTPIQRWFFEQGVPINHYNQAVMLEVTDLAPDLMEEALSRLIEHHDSFRLRFELKEQGWEQRYVSREENQIFWKVDLADFPPQAQRDEMQRVIAKAQSSLNIESGPMLRAVWFDFGKEHASRLLLAAHHLVVDGVSWRIILADLDRICDQLRRGEGVRLPTKSLSYARWSQTLLERARTAETLGELGFWTANLPRDLKPLPVDHEDAANAVSSMRALSIVFSRDDTERMLQQSRQTPHAGIDELLLAALVHAFSSWTREERLLIDLEGHGREPISDDVDVSSTVGWFTTMFPVLFRAVPGNDPSECIASIREQLARIPGKGIGYGLLRYLNGQPSVRTILEGLPQAQVSFNYLGRFDTTLAPSSPFALAREPIGETRGPGGRRSHLFEIDALIKGGRLEVAWHYSEAVHDHPTIRTLAEKFGKTLQRLSNLSAAPWIDGPSATGPVSTARGCGGSDAMYRGDIAGAVYPLSAMQKGLLFHSLYVPLTDYYITQLVCKLMGDLNRDVFEAAWQAVLDKHAVLRTSFEWEGVDEPVQIVALGVAIKIDQRDWRGFEDHEQHRMLDHYLEEDRRKKFNLRRAPLLRLALIRTSEAGYEFIFTSHHLLIDGWSLSILLADLFSVYESLCGGTPVSLQDRRPYSDYIAWLDGQIFRSGKEFWGAFLEGFSKPTPLAAPRNGDRSSAAGAYEYEEVTLRVDLFLAITSFAKAHKLTINTIGQGVWGLLCSIYSGTDDVVFGAVTSGRSMDFRGIESMVGLFISTLPVRVRVSGVASVAEWLATLQSQQAAIRENETYALSQVHSWSEVPAGVPLFESLFVFQNYPLDGTALRLSKQGIGGIHVERVRSVERSNYPLTVWLIPGEYPLIRMGYDRDQFAKETIRQLLEGFLALLEAIPANPDQPVADLFCQWPVFQDSCLAASPREASSKG